MAGKSNNNSVQMFADKGAGDIYKTLMSKAKARIGPRNVVEDPKQTCVHINAGKDGTAFAGAHPRKEAVLLNIRVDSPIKSKRMRKVEQISRNRFDCEMLLTAESDIDAEVLDWMRAAHELASSRKR